jgi:hypothetical protein
MSLKICPKCNTEFKYPNYLKKHLRTAFHCKLTEEEIKNLFKTGTQEEQQDIHKCNHCNTHFNELKYFNRHLKQSKCGKANTINNNSLNDTQTHTHSHNNSHNNITVNNNNTIIQHIYPLGYEKMPNIPPDEMKRLLLLGDKGVIDIVKLVCKETENKNFFKYNLNKNNISYLSDEFTIDICQESELKEKLLKQCVLLTNQMLLACQNILTVDEIIKINSTLNDVSKKIKEEIYDNGLKNIIENELRHNSKTTKDKIIKFSETVITDLEVKQKVLKNIDDRKKEQDENVEKEMKNSISVTKLNKVLGDPVDLEDFKNSNCYNDFYMNRFENTKYYKYWLKRVENEEILLNKHSKKTLTDIKLYDTRKSDIIKCIQNMKKINENIKAIDYNGHLITTEANFRLDMPIAYISANFLKKNIEISPEYKDNDNEIDTELRQLYDRYITTT